MLHEAEHQAHWAEPAVANKDKLGFEERSTGLKQFVSETEDVPWSSALKRMRPFRRLRAPSVAREGQCWVDDKVSFYFILFSHVDSHLCELIAECPFK